MFDELAQAIENKTAKIVVLGLGYVGLPVACMFAEAGFPVVGLRRDRDKAEMINHGQCPIEGKEPGLAELVTRVVAEGRLRATTDYSVCDDAQVVLVAVETPVEHEDRKPAYRALRSALRDLGPHLATGSMVIIESTIAPRTMELVVKPELEQASGKQVNRDFYLVNCPERVMPGKLLDNIRKLDRVVGGMCPEAAESAVKLYGNIVEGVLDPVDCITAEIVKTAENAYRDVQIAFANELALICEDMGADVWQVREMVNKCPGRNVHLPGAGVGGHCIPKDSWLLIAWGSEKLQAKLMPTARAVNDGMPYHMADLVVEALSRVGVPIHGAKVAVLGYAYLENSDDTRNTPTEPLVQRLKELGAKVAIHDPYVREYDISLREALSGADCLVLMVRHDQYLRLDLAQVKAWLRTPVILDGRNAFDAKQAGAAGFGYHAIGQGARLG
jgi:UDP-N-acetyl-D-mannosaminuronic acid dehydrogenase